MKEHERKELTRHLAAALAHYNRRLTEITTRQAKLQLVQEMEGAAKWMRTFANGQTVFGHEALNDDMTSGKLLLRGGRGYWHGKDLKFTIAEYRILRLLLSKPDDFFSYRDIYDTVRTPGFAVGKDGNGHKVNVRTLIRRIRGRFGSGFDQIETFRGVGYRWRVDDGEGGSVHDRGV